MRRINIIIREDKLNGRNALGIIYNGIVLTELEPTDEEMDEITELVWRVARRHI